ncbi:MULTISPECIES: Imm10 family immunity protein [unclassified Stenotrophomonas]|uniref:Imm10 family immunity protein n=1 Tax=unclassified Stenotrophomonas TaxID=196198 RepID=UPI00130F75FD|nr:MULTISPECIES: Imm10 family immunity protein [unclassified Stenotrophomonas]
MPEFIATVIHVGADDGVLLAGLADHEHDTRRYLLLQKAEHPDAQDIALGLDGVHVCLHAQARSAYGGIQSAQLPAGALVLHLDAITTDALGLAASPLRIALAAPPEDVAAFAAMLQRMGIPVDA